MNFIFPQNYNLKNKFLGFLDYSTILFNVIWIYILFLITSIFAIPLHLQVSFIIILSLPVLLFSILCINNENIFNIIKYLIKFITKPNLYIFYK